MLILFWRPEPTATPAGGGVAAPSHRPAKRAGDGRRARQRATYDIGESVADAARREARERAIVADAIEASEIALMAQFLFMVDEL